MLFYLTYNDTPSGIYSSQVIDVVNFFNNELKTNAKLVAFVSLRSFFKTRKEIKTELSRAVVLPMFPGVHRWKLNRFLLALFILVYKPHSIIGRSVLATQLALMAKQKNNIKKVVYDGRAAVKAEWGEYEVITNPTLLNAVFELEKQCVLQSDYRIAVSNELVSYWKKEFDYNQSNHAVIPCTLNSLFENITLSNETIFEKRKEIGFTNNDVVFVYSGSLAGWQSINLMIDFITTVLQKNASHKMLFLSELTPEVQLLKTAFPLQVHCKKVMPSEVPHYLMACDYGLLMRENSVTNQVASPVKFAEYLACGLDVIISEQLGDYTSFVKQHHCGFRHHEFFDAKKKSLNGKIMNQQLAKEFFIKKQFKNEYQKTLFS